MATKLALKLGDYCITEAGFGSDFGGEKFLDIKCRMAGLTPAAIVLVATIRALKYHGGVEKADLGRENTQAVSEGLENLAAHIDSLKNFGRPIVVAINQFPSDTQAEIAVLDAYLKKTGIPYALSQVHARGGDGGIELARLVAEAWRRKRRGIPLYLSGSTCPSKTRSSPSYRKCTAEKTCSTASRPRHPYAELRRWGLETCRSAWRKRSTP